MPIETIEDYHLKIKPTSKLINFIVKDIKNVKNTPENIRLLKKGHNDEPKNYFLSIKDIKWIQDYISEKKHEFKEKVYIHELLEGVNVHLPQPKVTPRNPELEARVNKLKSQQQDKDYKAMTKSVDSLRKHLPEDTIAFQMKLLNQQLIAVAQFVFSVLAGFAFGFIGIELLVNNLDFGFRLLLGIMCALVIALAEIYFLAKKLSEDFEEIPVGNAPRKLHQE